MGYTDPEAGRHIGCRGLAVNVTLRPQLRKPLASAGRAEAQKLMPSRPSSSTGLPADAQVYSVRQLNREAKQLLEGNFPGIWVSGEISRFTHHSSGHMYFDLKDADAQVSCALFRGSQRGLRCKPASGQQVLLRGKVSLFEARGNYQIIVEHLEEAGEGLLRRQLEELKARLQAEGLFAETHKQPLPALPMRIGVVTSPTGAAIRDILQILGRRHPLAEVIVYPVRVQGEGAAAEISTAIELANRRADCDLLIVGRGGGSLEDLWAFNEEIVARAIFASALPVVAAVGHEIDITVADLVADMRAPTPSGAAELVAPDRATLRDKLQTAERQAAVSVLRLLSRQRDHWHQQQARLRRVHPQAVLQDLQQRCDDLAGALARSLQRCIRRERMIWEAAHRRLLSRLPEPRLVELQAAHRRLNRQLQRAMGVRLSNARQEFGALSGNLHAVSPLATLERGYAIVHPAGKKSVITSAATLKTGDAVEAQLKDGTIVATVSAIRKSS